MKQNDIAMILIVVAISGVVSLFAARAFFTTSKDRHVQAEIVQPITTDFQPPSTKYFNANSIDPTQPIIIGGQANTQPFSGKQ